MTPTPEQNLIVSAARDSTLSLMVRSLAGTAKTTTAVLCAQAMSQAGVSLTFNVKAKEELERRLPKTWTPLTQNGLGHRAWQKAIGRRLEVDNKKLGNIISQLGKSYGLSPEDWANVRALVTKAMLAGVVPKTYPHKGLRPDSMETWADLCEELWVEPTERIITLARAVLTEDVKQGFAGLVHYDDQIYLSAMLGGVFPRYPVTIVDEAQDLNDLNHIQLARCSAGRILVFGDPLQSINAFRGAHSSSMEQIRKLRPEWVSLSLTVTFRCPQVIVERQQNHAPGFTAFHTNARGRVLVGYTQNLREGEEPFGTWVPGYDDSGQEKDQNQWIWAEIQALGHSHVAILSRNNAQLISMAFKLLRQRVGCKMLGRDIGKSLGQLAKKLLPDDTTPAEVCAQVILEWKEHQVTLARVNNHDEKVAGIVDRAESLLAVLEGSEAATASVLRQELERLFARDIGNVRLSTVHKFKGLEEHVVVHLDPWRIPSRSALRAKAHGDPVPLEQEKNLQYVCETRTKDVLVLVNLEDFK